MLQGKELLYKRKSRSWTHTKESLRNSSGWCGYIQLRWEDCTGKRDGNLGIKDLTE